MPAPDNPKMKEFLLVRRPEGRDPTLNLLTVAEVAELRGVTYHHCLQEIWRGRIPAWSVGGIYLVPIKDAEDWANRPRSTAGQQKKLKRINRAIDRQVKRDIANGLVNNRPLDPKADRARYMDSVNASPPTVSKEGKSCE